MPLCRDKPFRAEGEKGSWGGGRTWLGESSRPFPLSLQLFLGKTHKLGLHSAEPMREKAWAAFAQL
jgi:hypothetical protein